MKKLSYSTELINEANRQLAEIHQEVERLTLKCCHDGGRRNHSQGEQIDLLLNDIHQIKLNRNQMIKYLYSPLTKIYQQ